MRIAVLGAGKMGSSLARVWARAGHRIVISGKRDPGAIAALVETLGPSVSGMSRDDAVSRSEVIVLALPWAARTQIAGDADRLSGKIVLDAMNAYGPYPRVVDLDGATSSEIVAAELPGARVVKGLNTLQTSDILARCRPLGSPQRIAVPICGDDAAAKHLIVGLVDDIGFDAIDIGALPNGRWSEPERPLFGTNCTAAELTELVRKCVPSAGRAQGLRVAASAGAGGVETGTAASADALRPGTLDRGEVRVWCVRLSDDDQTVERAYRKLSAEERQRAAGFTVQPGRAAFVVSRGVLRTLLAGLCDIPPEDLEFEYGANGKPFLTGGARALHFSVSHSGDIAVYGVSLNGELGVDVEMHRPIADMEPIARRFFSGTEYEELLRVPEAEREAAFFDCWVRKEAYVKSLGGGLSIPLDSFWVSLAPGQPAALLGVHDRSQEPREWFLDAFRPAPRYSGAVALRSRGCSLRIHEIRPAGEMLQEPIRI